MSQRSEAASEQRVGRVVALERGSPIPLYMQIKQHLTGELAAADPRSDKFYTDSELCNMFGVSRMTVRQAVQELVAEGFVKRSRGVGTFILGRPLEEHLTPLVAFREQWVASGRPMAVELLTFETRPCPAGFAEDLAIDRSAPVRYVFRLRSAGEMPIALDHRYLPLALAAGVSQAEAATSILRALSGRFDFAHAEIHLEATTAGDDEVRWLKVPRGAPLMMRRLRFVTKDGVAVLAGYTVYRADLVRYSIHMPLVGEVPGTFVRAEDQDSVVRLRREVAAPAHGS